MQKILAVTDFSDTARLGVDWAAHIAGGHGAALTLFHALSPPTPLVLDVEFTLPEPDTYELLSEAAQQQMDKLVAEVEKAGVQPEGRVEIARHLGDVLRQVEEEFRAELLVIGSRGLTAFKHLVMGSNAEQAIRRSRIPVLVVHPGDVVPEAGPKNVLLATDFSEDADSALQGAVELLGPWAEGMRVTLLHSLEIPTDWTFMVGVEVPPPALREKMDRQIRAQLETRAATLREAGFEVDLRQALGDPSEAIVAAAEELGTELIVVGTHGQGAIERLFMGSTAVRTVQHAPCPVFAVRIT